MHVRDEHRLNETKARLKRTFCDRSKSQPAGPSSTSQPPGTTSHNMQSSSEAPNPRNEERNPSADTGSFRAMVEQHIRSAEEDEEDQDPVSDFTTIRGPIPLMNLFDFEDMHWVNRYKKAAMRNFDEELEMYEILDMDADGEEEADVDVDESTGDILFG